MNNQPVTSEQKAKNDKTKTQVAWLLQHRDLLRSKELAFVEQVPSKIDKYGSMTEKMEGWFSGIGKRIKEEVLAKEEATT